MHKPLYVEKQLGSLRDRALWETVSAAGEAGNQPRWTSKQQLQQQKGTKGNDTTGHTCEGVLEHPSSQEKSQDLRSEESNLHYADIQVCSPTRPRSVGEVKHLQLQNATEYATLCFAQATPCYDSKNGTLV
ncbi:uncharacterized protein C11orf52 homolog isoform X1 [Rousettus aegyptiacus]|uniref:uncharacterized protein C11orf52 homolog isoform X1 n=1 Tax=Rousettus aegyptiacus TaxID=9407 RepID=UPI00168D5F47|nr:uncharacterized protein C11orf52 homolog isoform X1 [Rousettus aegyptiacus]